MNRSLCCRLNLCIVIILLLASCQHQKETPLIRLFTFIHTDPAFIDNVKSVSTIDELEGMYENKNCKESIFDFDNEVLIDLSTTLFPNKAKLFKWDEINQELDGSLTYLCWEKNYKRDTTMYFASSYCGTGTLHINGKAAFKNVKGASLPTNYKRFYKLKLKKGSNSFMLKIKNTPPPKDNAIIKMAIFPFDKGRELARFQFERGFFNKVVFGEQDSVKLQLNGMNHFLKHPAYSIFSDGKQLYSRDFDKKNKNLSRIYPFEKHNVYTLQYHDEDYTYNESFIVGSPDSLYHRFKNNKAEELAPYLYRLDRLFEIEKRDYAWNRKVADLLGLIDNPQIRKTGMGLNAYQSSIDKSRQHYIAIAPQDIDHNKKYPLVIMVRPGYEYKTHPLTSMYLSKTWALSHIKSLSNAKKMIVISPTARVYLKEPLAPIGETDILEAIADVKKHYSIDDSQIYIYGSCLGARRAITFAEHHPELLAGMALYNPLIEDTKHIDFGAIKEIPCFLRHDIYDEHTPISNAYAFVSQAKAAGMPVRTAYETWAKQLYFNYFIGEDVFDFFKSIEPQKTKTIKPQEIAPDVTHFFGEKFAIVYASKREKDKDQALTLAAQWKEYFYGNCRVLPDTAKQIREDKEMNLLLLGNPGQNNITELLLPYLDIDIAKDEIITETESYTDKSYTYEQIVQDNDRMYYIVGTINSDTVRYSFKHHPWYSAEYTSRVSADVY